MPHLQIDCSPQVVSQIEPGAFISLLVDEFSEISTVDPASVKCYLRSAQNVGFGHLAPKEFVHLTICVLQGRPRKVLEEMSDRLYRTGQTYLKNKLSQPTSWTLEVREMDPSTYKKGTLA